MEAVNVSWIVWSGPLIPHDGCWLGLNPLAKESKKTYLFRCSLALFIGSLGAACHFVVSVILSSGCMDWAIFFFGIIPLIIAILCGIVLYMVNLMWPLARGKLAYPVYLLFFMVHFVLPLAVSFSDSVDSSVAWKVLLRRLIRIPTGVLTQGFIFRQVSIPLALGSLPGFMCYLMRLLIASVHRNLDIINAPPNESASLSAALSFSAIIILSNLLLAFKQKRLEPTFSTDSVLSSTSVGKHVADVESLPENLRRTVPHAIESIHDQPKACNVPDASCRHFQSGASAPSPRAGGDAKSISAEYYAAAQSLTRTVQALSNDPFQVPAGGIAYIYANDEDTHSCGSKETYHTGLSAEEHLGGIRREGEAAHAFQHRLMRKAWMPMRRALQIRLGSLRSGGRHSLRALEKGWHTPTCVCNSVLPHSLRQKRVGIATLAQISEADEPDIIGDVARFNLVMRFGTFPQKSSVVSCSGSAPEPILQWRRMSELPQGVRGRIASMLGFDPSAGPSHRQHANWNGRGHFMTYVTNFRSLTPF